MPRNAAGVYSLPDPPRVPATVIDSPDENTTRNDIGAELTNSLDRNGRGGMLAPFRIADGTLAAPGLAFLNEPGSGLYRIGAGSMALAVQGVKVMEFQAGQVIVTAANFVTGPVSITGAASFTAGVTINPDLTISPATFRLHSPAPLDFNIGATTADGADNRRFFLSSGGAYGDIERGAWIAMGGNEASSPGAVTVAAGNTAAGGIIQFLTGGANLQVQIARVPGADRFLILGGSAGGNPTITTNAGLINFGVGIIVPAGQALYLDGGFDTLFLENAANSIRLIAGGVPVLTLPSAAIAQFGNGFAIPAGQGVYLDGGSDTVILENVPNVIRIITGGTAKMDIGGAIVNVFTGLSIPSGAGLYLDGGADTFITEASADRMFFQCGGATQMTVGPNTIGLLPGTAGFSVSAPVANDFNIGPTTADGADNRRFFISGGGAYGDLNRGGFISVTGNESSSQGALSIVAGNAANGIINFYTGGGERGRITTSGFSKFTNDANYINVNGQYHELTSSLAGSTILYMTSRTANPLGFAVFYNVAAPNDTAHEFLVFSDSATNRMVVRSNGGILNFQANDINLSDATVKNYWEPYSVPQLEALSAAVDAMDFGRYKYRDQTHDDWNHGYVAQNVREAFAAVAPELVDYWDDSKKDLLAVYSTDLVNIHLAVARHEIRKLKERISQLEAGVT